MACTGEGRCTISDIDTSSTKSLPRVHRAVVFKTKFRHCKTQMERAEFKRMLIFWWKKKSFQLQILPLRTLTLFSSLCKVQRIEGGIKTFQVEAEPKTNVITVKSFRVTLVIANIEMKEEGKS